MDRDVESSAVPRKRASTIGRRVIAVIGVDRYRAWPTLQNAVSDANGALAVFQQLGFEQVTLPLINEAATTDAIRRLVTDDLATLGSNDSLVLFFAGHGYTQTRKLQSGPVETGFLIPVDGDPSSGRAATWLRLDTWLSDVARLPPRHILVILDACHSGIVLGGVIKWRGGGLDRHSSLDALRYRQSRRVITSALGDQRAMDGGPIHGHSLFTGCLIEGLTGGLAREGIAEVTGTEIGVYVQRRVASYTGSRQTPDFGTLELDDRGELILPACPELLQLQPRLAVRSGRRQPKAKDAISPARRGTWPVAATAAPIATLGQARNSSPRQTEVHVAPERTLAVNAGRASAAPGGLPSISKPQEIVPATPLTTRIVRFCIRCVLGLVATLLAVVLLQLCSAYVPWFGVVLIVMSGVAAAVIAAGRLAPRAPVFLRSFSTRQLQHTLRLAAIGLAIFAGVGSGMSVRAEIRACNDALAAAQAFQRANQFGVSAIFAQAANACETSWTRNEAEQARRATQESAMIENDRKASFTRQANFVTAIFDAQRQPSTSAGAEAAIASYRIAQQFGSLNKEQSTLFAIRLVTFSRSMTAAKNHAAAISALEEAKSLAPDLDLSDVFGAARAAARGRALDKPAMKAAAASKGVWNDERGPAESRTGADAIQPVDVAYPDGGIDVTAARGVK